MPLPNGLPTPAELAKGSTGAIVDRLERGNPYALHTEVVLRASDAVAGLSRRGIRKRLAREAQVNYLAVLDPASGASTQDRLKAADGAARVSGLVSDAGASRVSLVVTFKGLRRDVVDASTIEARVVEAAGLPPLAQQGDTGGGEKGD